MRVAIPVGRLGSVLALMWMVPCAAAAASYCDRDCMENLIDHYAAALVSHDAHSLPLAEGIRITENGVPVSPGSGIWQSARKFYTPPNTTQYVVDMETGQVAMMGVIDVGEPAMFAARLKVLNGRITEMEQLVKREGDAGGAFQPEGFIWREAPYIRSIPARLRSSRQALARTADRFWAMAETHRTDGVPYTPDCIRVENGRNVTWDRSLNSYELAHPRDNRPSDFDGRIWTCERVAMYTIVDWKHSETHRRLVDPERGLVMDWNFVRREGPGYTPPRSLEDGTPVKPGKTGPPTRGSDGWPLAARTGSGGAPLNTAVPPISYHAQVFRIVNGRIAREQVFWLGVSGDVASPF